MTRRSTRWWGTPGRLRRRDPTLGITRASTLASEGRPQSTRSTERPLTQEENRYWHYVVILFSLGKKLLSLFKLKGILSPPRGRGDPHGRPRERRQVRQHREPPFKRPTNAQRWRLPARKWRGTNRKRKRPSNGSTGKAGFCLHLLDFFSFFLLFFLFFAWEKMLKSRLFLTLSLSHVSCPAKPECFLLKHEKRPSQTLPILLLLFSIEFCDLSRAFVLLNI